VRAVSLLTRLNIGGIPIGSVLVIDGEIVGRGHNQRVQQGSTIRHAEMDCLEARLWLERIRRFKGQRTMYAAEESTL